ncbi:glycoside hydrolase family 16 protein [Puniceicoccus vermicola]|uniref:Family 16 glycosylhydrolase n=1 Tax=Puniceicoccus vermicola TaxID=388746 RepID=A0A7X1E5R4_9BACT|nr:glycoside hydrolase family 16 protein [Puniceicoccus vermicola]MBC2603424.1 family 16 glycosylhydrolase [Puniceicoccus vermicola]
MIHFPRTTGLLFLSLLGLMNFATGDTDLSRLDKSYQLLFEEDFEEPTLNRENWNYRTGSRQKIDSVNLADNVSLSDGRLVIEFTKDMVDGEQRYTSGGIISKALFGYGYYEAKAKLWGGGPGLHSSFWSLGMNQKNQPSLPRYNRIIEIDGYEVDSEFPAEIHTNIHYYIGEHVATGRLEGLVDDATVNTSEEDFIFGYEWLPDRINWYLNGTLIRTLKHPSFYGPQNVWVTALGTPNGFGDGSPVEDETLPGESSWDYFRFYAKPLPGVNLLGNGSFEYDNRNNAASKNPRDLHHPVAWIQEGDIGAGTLVESRESFEGMTYLRFAYEKTYRGAIRQDLTHIPNGTYELTARVRSSGGQELAEIRAEGFGGEPKRETIPKTQGRQWKKVTLAPIEVTENKCSITISTSSEPAHWLEVDDIVFARKGEKAEVEHVAPSSPKFLGEILLDDQQASFDNSDNWRKSTIRGKVGAHRYSKEPESWVRWTPEIPQSGQYRIEFYNVRYDNNVPEATLRIFSADGLTEKSIGHKGNEPEWIDLGIHSLKKGDANSVELSYPAEYSHEGFIRADVVRFIPATPSPFDEGLILKVGHNFVFDNLDGQRMDPSDPAITPVRNEDGEIYLPAEWALRTLPDFANGTLAPDHSSGVKAPTPDATFPTHQIEDIRYLAASEAGRIFGISVIDDRKTGIILILRDENRTNVPLERHLLNQANQLFPKN